MRLKKLNRKYFAFLPVFFLAAALCLFAAQPFAQPIDAQSSSVTMPNFADLTEKLLPAVVNVSTTQIVKQQARQFPEFQFPPGSPFEDFFKDFFERGFPNQGEAIPRKATALGSGFIIDAAGYIVTNNHVIAEADEVSVILQNDAEYQAEVIGRDPKLDLALLKIKADKPLPYLKWGNSDSVRVGEWVLAIGNPFGLGGTVTAGIVSARARNINAGPYDDFIQTDASINRGNSGGPMFNLNGEVVGINTAIFSPTGGSVGIGFAVPSSLAKPVIEQLRQYGHAKRGWLGVRIQEVTAEIAENLGLKGAPRGALIAGLSPNGPADAARIEVGDIILKFDGKEILDMRRLPLIVAETPIGQSVDVTVWRKNRAVDLRVKVAQLDEEEEKALASSSPGKNGGKGGGPSAIKTVKLLGLTLSNITQPLRQRFEIGPKVEGALITAVDPASEAAEQALRTGDVITEVSQQKTASPEAVAAAIEAAKKAKRKSVLLLVSRADDVRFVALKLDE